MILIVCVLSMFIILYDHLIFEIFRRKQRRVTFLTIILLAFVFILLLVLCDVRIIFIASFWAAAIQFMLLVVILSVLLQWLCSVCTEVAILWFCKRRIEWSLRYLHKAVLLANNWRCLVCSRIHIAKGRTREEQ